MNVHLARIILGLFALIFCGGLIYAAYLLFNWKYGWVIGVVILVLPIIYFIGYLIEQES